jgi:exonuclease VII small subunit
MRSQTERLAAHAVATEITASARPLTIRLMSTEGLSLAVAALAVVVGPVGAYMLGVRRFAHERELDDRNDARSILAEGALELGRVKSVMKDALTKFGPPLNTGEDWPDDFEEEIGRLEKGSERLEQALAAVRIRFEAGSAVIEELNAALVEARKVTLTYVLARGSDEAGGPRREQLDRKGRDDTIEVMDASLEFDQHRDSYLVAAQKVVGVELNSQSLPSDGIDG